MRQNTGAARGARIAVRLSREDRDRIDEAVKARGYTSPSAFIRAAIQNELNWRPVLTETEDRIAGGFERMSRDKSPAGPWPASAPRLAGYSCQNSSYVHAGAIQRCTHYSTGSDGTWHELTKSGYGHRRLVAEDTSAWHGPAALTCSCTTPAAREKQATPPTAEKGRSARPYFQRCAVG